LSVVSCQWSVVFQQPTTNHLPLTTDPLWRMTPRTEKTGQRKLGPGFFRGLDSIVFTFYYDREKVSAFSPGIC